MRVALQAVVVLGLALVEVGCEKTADPQSLYREALDLWAETQGSERRFALRIHGVEAHAPCSRTSSDSSLKSIRCDQDGKSSPEQVAAWSRLMGEVESALAVRESPGLLHARALARLWFLSARRLRLAEQDLETALGQTGRPPPAILNDLAIVRRLRAEIEDRPEWLIHALDAALAAAEAERTPAVLFNVASLSQESGLRGLAHEGWREVLAAVPGSAWVEEAHAALGDLETPPPCDRVERALMACRTGLCGVEPLPSLCGEVAVAFLQDELLPAWADAVEHEENRVRSTRLRAAIRKVVQTLGAVGTADAVARLAAELLAEERPGEIARWAGALGDYARGRRHLERIEVEQAASALLRARARAPEGSILGLLVDFELARTAFMRRKDLERARELLRELDRRTAGSSLWRLRGDVARFRGLVEGSLGFGYACRASYEAALDAYGRSQSELSTGRLASLRAEHEFFVGRPDAAWEIWLEGMTGPGAVLRDRNAYDLLSVATLAIQNEGLRHAGLTMASELVRVGERIAAPAYEYEAHLRRGTALAGLGRTRAALAELHAAAAAADEIADGIRDSARSNLDLFKAEILTPAEPGRAIDLLTGSYRDHRDRGLHFFLSRILSARAEAYRRLGQRGPARSDLRDAVAELESAVAHLDQNDLETSFLDRRQQVFNRLLDLELEEAGAAAASLAVAEQARTGSVGRATATGVEPGELRRRIAASNACVLYYRVLADELLIWVGFGDAIELIQAPVGEPQLRSLVRSLSEGLAGRDETAFKDASTRLYDLLVRPAEGCGEAIRKLVLVPDGFLYAVPFAVLRRPETGRFLVEERSYRLLPGLAWLDSKRPGRPGATLRTVVVAAPRASAARYPSLLPLAHAEAEARAIAEIHPAARVLVGGVPERGQLTALLRDAALFHFAGHAVANFEFPLRSALLIGDGELGELTAADLGDLRLPNLELVFLSSCQAMNGPASSSAGALSLARAFIASGVRAVVASVSDVDDERTAELSIGFHRRLGCGVPASEALRAAQLEILGRGGPLAAWAGYSVLGEETSLEKPAGRSVQVE